MRNYQLSDSERLWLQTIYDFVKKGQNASYRALKTLLYKNLPKGFDPSSIDIELTGHYKGEDITLVGVNFLDPDRRIIDKTNKTVRYIRDLLLTDYYRKEVTSQEIADNTSLPLEDISLILRLASRYMSIYDSASGYPDMYGYQSIKIDRDETYDAYLNFESIERIISQYLLKEKEDTLREKDKHKTTRKEPQKESASLNSHPIFRSRIEHIDLKMCFVLMPFTEDWSRRVYQELIRANIEPMGIQCLRADNLSGPIIMEDIWVKINQSAFVIADVTGRNPNVMYEMGIVHTIGKPCILLTQEIDSIPFDFSHLRHHDYKDNVEGFREMGDKLKRLVKDLYEANYTEVESPII
tara:strand:+ start:611 stop:1669 length:1059 start_codon:yes stop_codon:yes gene_type:complete